MLAHASHYSQDVDGRVLSDIFMVRPSRKLYPEYYLVIPHPIDLKEIRSKIAATKVSCSVEPSAYEGYPRVTSLMRTVPTVPAT